MFNALDSEFKNTRRNVRMHLRRRLSWVVSLLEQVVVVIVLICSCWILLDWTLFYFEKIAKKSPPSRTSSNLDLDQKFIEWILWILQDQNQDKLQIKVVKKDISNARHINPFIPNAPFLYPLRTSENLTAFWYFKRVEKGCFGNKYVDFASSIFHCVK